MGHILKAVNLITVMYSLQENPIKIHIQCINNIVVDSNALKHQFIQKKEYFSAAWPELLFTVTWTWFEKL